MEYIDAWETSIKMIKYCYRAYKLYEWHLSYDDFYQECALCFWGQLKPKFDALNSLNICSKAYRWVALNSLKKQQNFYCNNCEINEIDWKKLENKEEKYLPNNNYNLQDNEFQICLYLIMGYQLEEIADGLGFSKNTVQTKITTIRKKLAKEFGLDISNHYGKHRNYKLKKGKVPSGKNNPKSKPIIAYLNGKPALRYESARLAERDFGSGVFASVKKGYKCKGYMWKYETN